MTLGSVAVSRIAWVAWAPASAASLRMQDAALVRDIQVLRRKAELQLGQFVAGADQALRERCGQGLRFVLSRVDGSLLEQLDDLGIQPRPGPKTDAIAEQLRRV